MIESICAYCERYRRGDTCEAFPEGIPREIRFGGADHRLPWPGDNGVLFEALDPTATRLVNRLWGKRPKPYDPLKLPAGVPYPDA